jgi:NADH-quinone oxidoreductase subunit J
MSAGAVIFYVFAVITVGSAAVVVLARSLIYSAFALLFTFFGVAGLYVLLGADFLAATQLLIYVGGILVLLLFGVMLTHKLYDLDLRSGTTQFFPGLIVAAGLFTILTFPGIPKPGFWRWQWWPFAGRGLVYSVQWMTGPGRPPSPTTAQIGAEFMGRYLLPFEAASILLLVALMGAAMIVRRKKDA